MARWDLTGKKPDWFSQEQQRYIVGTNEGWVYERRYVTEMGNLKIDREVLVTADGLSNSTNMGSPTICEIFLANVENGSALVVNEDILVGVVYDEPLKGDATGWTLKVYDIAANVEIDATANSTLLYANNVLVFGFSTSNAGTYKIEAQTISNTTDGVLSNNPGNESVELVISAAVSNALGEFIVE